MSLVIDNIGLAEPILEFYTGCNKDTLKHVLTYGHNHMERKRQQDTDAFEGEQIQRIKLQHSNEINKLNSEYSKKIDIVNDIHSNEIERINIKIKHMTTDYSTLQDKHNHLYSNKEQEIKRGVDLCMKYADDAIIKYNDEIKRYKLDILQRRDTEITLQTTIRSLEDAANQRLLETAGSKTKGNRGEIDVQKLIESAGYTIKKPGNKCGDLWVYHGDYHIAVLEIKNYGDKNKSKLGIRENGDIAPEMEKFYRDSVIQLDAGTTTVEIPWLFISLGCDIPNESKLDAEHNGIKCFYLSQPTELDIIGHMILFNEIYKVNSRSKTETTNLMQCKIQELHKQVRELVDMNYDFKIIEKMFCDAVKTAEANKTKFYSEKTKYNKRRDDTNKRVQRIVMEIDVIPTGDIDLLKDIDTERLTLDERVSYNKNIRRLALEQQFRIMALEAVAAENDADNDAVSAENDAIAANELKLVPVTEKKLSIIEKYGTPFVKDETPEPSSFNTEETEVKNIVLTHWKQLYDRGWYKDDDGYAIPPEDVSANYRSIIGSDLVILKNTRIKDMVVIHETYQSSSILH